MAGCVETTILMYLLFYFATNALRFGLVFMFTHHCHQDHNTISALYDSTIHFRSQQGEPKTSIFARCQELCRNVPKRSVEQQQQSES